MKHITRGSFIIRHEAANRFQASDEAEALIGRMETAIADGVLVSDYFFQHETRVELVDEVLENQLPLFEEESSGTINDE